MPAYLHTLTGRAAPEALGLILPHEHLFTDLRGPADPGYAQADLEAVVRRVLPYLQAAHAAGVTALVECSTVGVGRNLAVLRRLAQASPVRILAPCGVYREAYTPEEVRTQSIEALAELWVRELLQGIEGSGLRAGFLKLAVSDDGPTPLEVRHLQAAARASRASGAALACHTIGGRAARAVLDALQAEGLDLRRFIWVHAHTEPDLAVQLEAARRGAWIELDAVGHGGTSQERLAENALALIQAGCTDQLLLSHDAGWYDPAAADGVPPDGYRGYTALVDEFLPALRARGAAEAQLRQITVENPFRAFAF